MSPNELLKSFIISYMEENKLHYDLKNAVPKKWEKYGDFVLFDERIFRSEIWKSQNIVFWEKVASVLKCKRIGIKNKIKNDNFRSPNVTIVLGCDPWTLHKDNGIYFTWNVLENMFSAGNSNERHRIAKFNCEGETVIDMFAGIGYFTLPYLVHAKAAFVHACEWNPVACEALKRNLKLNKVTEKCKIYEGDNKLLCPKKVANRVNLGLLPSSEKYWRTACDALVEEGGFLHVHENVEVTAGKINCQYCELFYIQISFYTCKKNLYLTNNNILVHEGNVDIDWKHKEWLIKGLHILHSIMTLLNTGKENNEFYVSIENLNFVKSYAPRIHHLVYDIKIKNISFK